MARITKAEVLKQNLDKAHEALSMERYSHEKTRKELQELKTDFINLQRLSRKETGKSVPINLKPFEQIELENEIRRLKAESVDIRELEREKFLKEEYMRLLEEEKKKCNELKKSLKSKINTKSYQTQIDTLNKQTEELRKQLQEEKAKHARKGTGRRRNNNTPDDEVLKLRAEGKTVKVINSLTGISTATINRILKKSKTE